MLEVLIGGQHATLSKKTTINLNYNSSLFDFGKLSGTYSSSFKLPFCGNNRRIFGYADSLPVFAVAQDYECQVLFAGALIESGTLVLKNASENGFECHLTIGEGTFVSRIKGQKLNALEWGKSQFSRYRTAPYDPLSDSFTLCQLRNRKFYSGSNRAFFQNRFDAYTGMYAFTESDMKTAAPDEFEKHLYPVTPFPYVGHLLAGLVEKNGFRLGHNELDGDELRTLALYSNYDICSYSETTERYGEQYDGDGNVIPEEDKQEVESLTRTALSSFEYKEIVPEVDTADFLLALFNYFALSLKVEGKEVSVHRIADLLKAEVASDLELEKVEAVTEPYTGYTLTAARGFHAHDSELPQTADFRGAFGKWVGGDSYPDDLDEDDAIFDEGPIFYQYFVRNEKGYMDGYSPCQDYSVGSSERTLQVKNTVTFPGGGVIDPDDSTAIGTTYRRSFGRTIYLDFKGMEGRGRFYNVSIRP